MYKIHESITLFNNSASVSHMFTLSAFKPSSGINQDYANGKKKYLIFATIVKLSDDRESHCSRKEILYHVGFRDVVNAGHLNSHGYVHWWTCGRRSEKRKQTCPLPSSDTHTYPRTPSQLFLNPSASHLHSITHLFLSHPPSSHVSNTPTVHRD